MCMPSNPHTTPRGVGSVVSNRHVPTTVVRRPPPSLLSLLQRRVNEAAAAGSVPDVERILEVAERSSSRRAGVSWSASRTENAHASALAGVVVPSPLLIVHPHEVSVLATSACLTACTYGHGHIVEYLLHHWWDHVRLDARDEDGDAALDCAAAAGFLDIVHLLLWHNTVHHHRLFDVNACDGWGRTALHYAAQKGAVAVVRRLLRDPWMDVNRRTADTAGHTALHWASHNGHTNVVRLLLAHPNIKADILTNEPCQRTVWDMARDEATRSALREVVCQSRNSGGAESTTRRTKTATGQAVRTYAPWYPIIATFLKVSFFFVSLTTLGHMLHHVN